MDKPNKQITKPEQECAALKVRIVQLEQRVEQQAQALTAKIAGHKQKLRLQYRCVKIKVR